MKYDDEIRLVFSRRQLKLLLAAVFSLGAGWLMSESFTLSTSYPAPSGIYNQMITTGNTYLARDGGIGSRVGIGTTAPAKKLSVAGDGDVSGSLSSGQLSVGGDANVSGNLTANGYMRLAPGSVPAGVNGTIYYDQALNKFRVYQNNGWTDLIQAAQASASAPYTTATCVATAGSGCSATLGTAGLPTTSATTTYNDSSSCGYNAVVSYTAACNMNPANCQYQWVPETISCTATNTPAP